METLELKTFASSVQKVADRLPPDTGNKVFISRIWEIFKEEWSVDRGEFNHRLIEAHKRNLLGLARYNLGDVFDPDLVRDSEVSDQRYRLHFIRQRVSNPKYSPPAPTPPSKDLKE